MANAFNLTAQLNLRGPSNLKPVIKNIKSQLGNINANVNLTVAKNSSANIAKLNAGLKALNKTLNTTTVTSRNAANAISSLGTAIKGINASQVSASINKATQASKQLAAQQQTVSKSLASSRTEMEEFGKQSGLAIRRFAAFSAVTAVVFKLNNAINTGVSSFIEFEQQFIRLQQVTGDSAQSLSRLQTSITKLSTGLGVTSQELSQVSVTLAQAGLNARETEKALEALALSALAPSFDNLNNTVEGSIALMRQFGISSNELGSALGSINAVAASFAVEAGDIIKAISRTGGVFANASKGVSEGTDALNEFIAVFTSVRATTRESAETIATGLRTIFTRIQRGSTIEALKEFGVTLTDLEGKFVGPFKAIQLLSEGLGRLDPRDISFSNIVEELGGFRQIGKVIPLIQQFATAQRALGVANAGQGSLAEDAAIAQLSLANQIAKVREEFLGLFREIGGSDSFQTIAKGALGLASALIKIADSVKGVLPVLAIMGAAKGLSAVTQFTAGFAGGIKSGGGARGFGSRMSGAPSGFATGGLVPGQGNRDTVPAMLTPGEFVIRKKAVETIGASKLGSMNKYAGGGKVQKFAKAGPVRYKADRGSKMQEVENLGARDGDSWRVNYIPSPDKVGPVTTRAVGYDAYEIGKGKGRKWERALGQIATDVADSEFKKGSSQAFTKGFNAVGDKNRSIGSRPLHNVGDVARELISQGLAVPAGSKATGSSPQPTDQQIATLKTFSFEYDKKTGKTKGGPLRPGFNLGGSVQRFENGGGIKVAKTGKVTKAAIAGATTSQIQSLLTNPNVRKNPASMASLTKALKEKQLQEAVLPKFAVIGLRGRNFNEKVKAPSSKKAVNIMGSVLPKGIADAYEGQMADGFTKTVKGISGQIAGKVGANVISDTELKAIITETGFYNAVGAYLESAVAGVGAPFLKSSINEPIDFPAGVGNVGSMFGIPGNIPTDTTRTVAEKGKSPQAFLGQVDRYIEKYGTTGALKLAAGGSVADTVPALLTPGEFVINKKAARSIGSAQLNKMNKADKLQGFNKGGPVGFADGGGVPLRPDVIQQSTVAIPDSARQGLEEIINVLEELGVQSKATSSVVANQGRVSYETAIDASKADLAKAKAAGASSAQIGVLTKNLINLQSEASASVKKRQGLESAFGAGGRDSATQQANILSQAETLAEGRIAKASATKGKNLTAEDIAKIRDSSFSDATRSVTGVSNADLKASGIKGSDIQQYISETELDLKSQDKFLEQFQTSRQKQLLSQKTQAGTAKYTAEEAKKLAAKEVKARRDVTKQIQKSRGLPTGGGFGSRLKGMGGPQASIAASLALPMITDFFAGGEPTSASGASSQALVQGGAGAISTGLAVGSIAGPIAGLAAGAVTLVKSFADAQNAAVEFAEKLSRSKIEESAEKLNKAFEILAKNAEDQQTINLVEAELRNISDETRKLVDSNNNTTQVGLLNMFDVFSSSEAFNQRGEVLSNQGIGAYLQTLFNSSGLEDAFDKERPRIARENAKLFAETTQATREFIHSLVNSGKTYEELINDPNLLKFSENLVLADVAVQRAIQNIQKAGGSSADVADFVARAAAEKAREQINISINTKALDDLNKSAKELSISFKRLFSSMDQQVARATFSLARFDEGLEQSINALSGSARIGESSSRDANILENPLAFSSADFNSATARSAGRFGEDSTLVRGILQLGPSLEDSILKTINTVLANDGDNPEIAKGRINRAVQEELKNLGLPASLAAKLSREIAKAVGDITNETDKGSVSLQELTEKISGLNDLIGTSAQARKTAINALNQWQSSLNSYASAINKITEMQLESANRLRRASSILFDAQVSLAGALGKDISLDTLERERDRDIRSRTGGLNDPVDIANSLSSLLDRRQAQAANRQAAGADINAPDASAAVVKTTQELAKTNFQINETRAALESLANDSNLASAALNKIQKAQQDQAGKVTFIEKLVTSTPAELKNLNNSFADLQRYISGQAISIQESTAAQKAYRKALRSGASRQDAQKEAQKAFADQRGNALSLLKEISPFLGDNQQSNDLRASALETMLRESGVGLNPMLTNVLDALRNPQLDPATAKAISTYEKAINIQSQANVQLARLNDELASKIAKSSAEAIRDALEGVTVKFDQQQLDDLVNGIRTAVPGGKPDGKAAGGIIYASQGTAVDFAPQGTDTVPAMLTPGEFVVNRSATQKNRPILEAINNGYSKGGSVSYYAGGGFVAGSAAAADDIWKYDASKKPITVDSFREAPTLDPYDAYTGLTIGREIAPSKVVFENDQARVSVPPLMGEGLTDDANTVLDKKILRTNKLLSISQTSKPLAEATLAFTKDAFGIKTKVSKNSLALGSGKRTFQMPVFRDTAKQYEEADFLKLVQDYGNVNLGRQTPGQKVGAFEEFIDASGGKLKIPLDIDAITTADPTIGMTFESSLFNDTVILKLKKLAARISDPDAGLGFFYGQNPAAYGKALMGYDVPNKTQADFGAGQKNIVGDSIFESAEGDNIVGQIPTNSYSAAMTKFSETKDRLNELKGLYDRGGRERESIFQDTDAGQKKITDKLKKIYTSNSPFMAYGFPSTDLTNLDKIGALKEAITIYGGGQLEFENKFRQTIQNLVGTTQIQANQTSLGTGKPIYISATGGPGKAFGWTQGVDLEDLDVDFAKRKQEAEDEMSRITGTNESKLKGFFNLDVPVNGNQQSIKIPYHLNYTKFDGKLWDSNNLTASPREMSDLLGGPGYILNAVAADALNPYAKFNAGNDIALAANQAAFDSDLVVSPDFIESKFQNATVKNYLGEVIEQSKTNLGSKTAALGPMSTTLAAGNGLSFFKKSNNTFIDPNISRVGLPTNARTTSLENYLTAVADQVLKAGKDAQEKAGSQVANPEEFKSTLSHMKYLKPAFETIANTAFSLFGAGGPYSLPGSQFGVPVQNLVNRQQIRDLSGILGGQLNSYTTGVAGSVVGGNFPNLASYDLYNNAEVLSHGAMAAFNSIAGSNTNLLSRYLNPEDLIKDNFNWQTLKDKTLTMFRALGAGQKSNAFLDGAQGKLTVDDKLDLSSILGEGDSIISSGPDKDGKFTRGKNGQIGDIDTLRNVLDIAFNPYNRFDEITDRKILINAIKARFMGATGSTGRPLFSQQMTQNVMDSMDAVKLWFGGEPGANADIAQPPEDFNAEGLSKEVKQNQQQQSSQTGSSVAGNVARGITAAGSFLPGLAGAGGADSISGAAASIRTSAWKGVDYLYDRDPATPDYATRLTELQNGFDQKIYDEAQKGFAELGALGNFGSLPPLDYYKSLGDPGYYKTGGMIYASQGQLVDFEPKGTDTVPAMLTPGEFVINKQATQKNLPLLKAINNGGAESYGANGVMYAADGTEGPVRSPAQTRAQKVQRFIALDKNKNGVLEGDEFPISKFRQDTNLDGLLTLDEFIGIMDNVNADDIKTYRNTQRRKQKFENNEERLNASALRTKDLKEQKKARSAYLRTRQEALDIGASIGEANAAGQEAYRNSINTYQSFDRDTYDRIDDLPLERQEIARKARERERLRTEEPIRFQKERRATLAADKKAEEDRIKAERAAKKAERLERIRETERIRREAEAKQAEADEKLKTKLLGGRADYRGRDKQRLDFDDDYDRGVMRKKVIADNYTFKDKTGGFSTTGTIEGVDYDAKMITIGKIDPKTGQPLLDDDGNQRTTTVPLDKLGDKTLERVTSSDQWNTGKLKAEKRRADKILKDKQLADAIQSGNEGAIYPIDSAGRPTTDGPLTPEELRQQNDIALAKQTDQVTMSTFRNLNAIEAKAIEKRQKKAARRAKTLENKERSDKLLAPVRAKKALIEDINNQLGPEEALLGRMFDQGKASSFAYKDSAFKSKQPRGREEAAYRIQREKVEELKERRRKVKNDEKVTVPNQPIKPRFGGKGGIKATEEEKQAINAKYEADLAAWQAEQNKYDALRTQDSTFAAGVDAFTKAPVVAQGIGAVQGVAQTAQGMAQTAGGALGMIGSVPLAMVSDIVNKAPFIKDLTPDEVKAFTKELTSAFASGSLNMTGEGLSNFVGGGITFGQSLGLNQDELSKTVQQVGAALQEERLARADELGVGGAVRALDTISAIAADFAVGEGLFSVGGKLLKAAATTRAGGKLAVANKYSMNVGEELSKGLGKLNEIGQMPVGEAIGTARKKVGDFASNAAERIKKFNETMSSTPRGKAQAAKIQALRENAIKAGIPENQANQFISDAIETQKDLSYRIQQNEGLLPDRDLLDLALNRRDRLKEMGYDPELAAKLTGLDFFPENQLNNIVKNEGSQAAERQLYQYLESASPEELAAFRKSTLQGQQPFRAMQREANVKTTIDAQRAAAARQPFGNTYTPGGQGLTTQAAPLAPSTIAPPTRDPNILQPMFDPGTGGTLNPTRGGYPLSNTPQGLFTSPSSAAVSPTTAPAKTTAATTATTKPTAATTATTKPTTATTATTKPTTATTKPTTATTATTKPTTTQSAVQGGANPNQPLTGTAANAALAKNAKKFSTGKSPAAANQADDEFVRKGLQFLYLTKEGKLGKWRALTEATVGGGVVGYGVRDYSEKAGQTSDVVDQPLVDPTTPAGKIKADQVMPEVDLNAGAMLLDDDKKKVVYASNGALIQAQSSGSDTVPAMLTPGEFVMNRLATSQNRPMLESMNSGQFNSGGLVRYMASGGYVQPQRLENGSTEPIRQTQMLSSSGGVNNVSMESPAWVDAFLGGVDRLEKAGSAVGENINAGAQQLAGAVPNSVDINSNVNVQGSVGLDSQSLGRAVAMGSQQGQNYADKKVGDVQSKIQSDTDGGLSFYA